MAGFNFEDLFGSGFGGSEKRYPGESDRETKYPENVRLALAYGRELVQKIDSILAPKKK